MRVRLIATDPDSAAKLLVKAPGIDPELLLARAVVVANAHPDVLAVAHEVTASNDADGVAAWLLAELSAA